LALATLFLATFVLGTAELGVVGMLNLIADDMRVSVSAAGTLVSAYALGLAMGGPVLAALTIRFPRRLLLAAALLAYLGGTLLAVLAANLQLLIAARVLTGSLHGLFVGVALTVAVSVAPPGRTGRAIAAVIGGFAVSAALGLPLGTLIGQAAGWRGAFVAFVVLGGVCLIAVLAFIPPVANSGAAGLFAQVRHALAPRVLAVLGLAFLLFAGQYAALTYIAPFLQRVTGISGGLISVFLLAYGAATAVGVFGGGRFADKVASRTLIVANAALVAALGALYLIGAVPVLVAAALILWGLFGMGLVPSLQYRVVSLARSRP
jgi:DHA1 family inner membrane transport protein